MKKTLILFAVALIMSALCYFTVLADGYDSTTDPVVTLSYVNNNLLPQIEARINELKLLIDNGGSGTGSSGASSEELNSLASRISALEGKTNNFVSLADFNALKNRVTALESAGAGNTGDNGGGQTTVVVSGGMQYEAVFVEYGKTVIAPTTSIELILRSGSAVVVSPFADQGLSDVTAGKDLLNNYSITKNHALIIPRAADGRGMRITSLEGAYVMIRGEYSIVD